MITGVTATTTGAVETLTFIPGENTLPKLREESEANECTTTLEECEVTVLAKGWGHGLLLCTPPHTSKAYYT